MLEAFELEVSSLRAEEPLPDGKYGPSHYRKLHWHLFRDVYRWAGEYRTVRTAKDNHVFCYPEQIQGQMEALFRRLGQPSFLPGSTDHEFVTSIAEFLAELNAIHPFRYSNGRCQLAFLHMLGLRGQHELKLERINPDGFLIAMIESFNGNLVLLERALAALLV